MNPSLEHSFVANGSAYVKGKYAITATGVVRRGAGRAFSVAPSELEWNGAVIGRGCSGCVRRSTHLPTNTPLALKVISLHDKSKREQVIREINTLFDSDCPCLLGFYGAFLRDGAVVLVLEYMDGGSLENVIHQVGRVPEEVVAGIAYQLLVALGYLKSQNRVHRDLKPPNLLVSSTGHVKLSDFGIASELTNSVAMCATFVGSFRYMSPERLHKHEYNFGSDVWSLGLVLMEVATGVYPYASHAGSCIELIQTISDSPSPALSSDYFSTDFCGFVAQCLAKDPVDRPTADTLLQSPWLVRHNTTSLNSSITKVRDWIQSLQ